ncbi:hypothetical protein FRC08_010630 [Ceratobasidium sp. 394]|nr:hypothetical protein FRC08_010630 [Ceratobasidium sp. 394]
MVHGDLKSGNVLVSEQGVAKLSDFGNTRLKEASLHFTTGTTSTALSIRWAAPELLAGKTSHTMEADVYALGMTILEVVTGNLPFNDLTDMAVCTGVLLKQLTPVRPRDSFPLNTQRSNQLWNLVTRCWVNDAAARPTAAVVAEKLSRIVINDAFMPPQDPIILRSSSKKESSFRLSIPHSTTIEVEGEDTQFRKHVTTSMLGHYQIVNCSLETIASLPNLSLGHSAPITGPDPTSSWILKLQDDGNYQFKTEGARIATSLSTRSNQVNQTGTSSTNAPSYCDAWDVVQTSTGHFRIQHPELYLCWGV